MKDTTEFFQSDSADETLAAVIVEYTTRHPNRVVIEAKFAYAYPGDSKGRWVGIDIEYRETK